MAIKNSYTLGFALIMVACLAIPAFQRIQKIQERTKDAPKIQKQIIVASNLKRLGEAMRVYSNDYQSEYDPNYRMEENAVAASLELLVKEAGIEPNFIYNIEE